MPTYEYACRSCGTHVEVYQRFSDPPLTECGVCGGPLRKVFHPAGILFKGSGFYATDSRRGRDHDGAARTEGGGGKKGANREGSVKEGAGGQGTGKDKPAAKPAGDPGTAAAASSTKESA